MNISEIFYSIQGEGMLVGMPSLFVRTAGCNLRCAWCDTPYTSWEPEGEEIALDDLLSRIQARYVVVTGGEPMIAPEIVPLTVALRERGHHITIETAGTVYAPVACDLMSVSPKLGNSTPEGRWAAQHERLRIQPEVLRRLTTEYDYQLKFVVAKPGDLGEIQALVTQLGAPVDRVVLMPEGTTREVIATRNEWLIPLCKQTGYRYSPRLHIDLFGNQRGA